MATTARQPKPTRKGPSEAARCVFRAESSFPGDRGAYDCLFTVGLLGRVHELLLLSLLRILLHVFLPMVLHLVVRGPFLL